MNAFKTASPTNPYTYTNEINDADTEPNKSSLKKSRKMSSEYPKDLEHLAHLAMGQRMIFLFKPEGERQFVVFKEGFNAENDPDCKNVIGSGYEPLQALHAAKMYLFRAQLKPEDFQPRLKGCTFAKATDKTVSLKHLVLNSEGVEISRNELRNAACRQALHSVLANSKDITLEEFRAISVVVNIERGGKDSYGWLYADDQGQSAVRRLVRTGFTDNAAFRDSAVTNLALKQQIDQTDQKKSALKPARAMSRLRHFADQRNARRDALFVNASNRHEDELFTTLLQKVNECLLSQPTDKDLVICPLSPENGQWVGEIVAHTSKISPETALRNAHEQFIASAERAALVESMESVVTTEREVEH